MKTPNALWAVALIGLSCLLTTVAAGRLTLRPLTPQELRSALVEAGVDEGQLTPIGRATPSAIAGLGGFALGVANGLGGALIFDLLTSNETAAYVSNLINSLNSTSADGGSSGGAGGSTQEVCFQSRSLGGDLLQGRANDQYEDFNDDRDLYDYEDDDYYSGLGRQATDDYYSDYPDPIGGTPGITCIVVNKGRSIFRHRRSTELTPKQPDESKPAVETESESTPVAASTANPNA
ncbi:hypothetical protein AWZ03_004580 [Drosophila navojoa]|uniref:DUF4794 domain-containing protein n=1 Tax=Drosophila navojoa TaxID=7232 RepID=A0A484BJ56_DRONA|nr:uncharacterized protein LOC108652659 [Drosophila navojoa]TDG48896.1 hypothetical protein AWZ03_004580 [Drosophila navojoa]